LGLIVAGVGTLSVLRPMLELNQSNTLVQLRSDPAEALAPQADVNNLGRDDILYANRRYYVALLGPDGTLQYDNARGDRSSSTPEVPPAGSINSDGFTPMSSPDGTEWQAITIPIVQNGAVKGTLLIAMSSFVDQVLTQYVVIFTAFGVAVILLGAA